MELEHSFLAWNIWQRKEKPVWEARKEPRSDALLACTFEVQERKEIILFKE